MRQRWWWIAGAGVVLVVLAVGVPFVYIHVIEGPAPARLSLPTAGSAKTGPPGAASGGSLPSGTYHVAAGSRAGYRVTEVLLGQHSTAVGRTTEIWGSVTVGGDAVTAGGFTVDMASVKSDQSERNAQFDGRIMDVATYPTATLQLTEPIALGAVPAVGARARFTATGDLAMHGVTRTVTFPVTAERTAGGLYALADLHIVFSRWDIANPSVGGFVTTESSGTLEVLVRLTRGAGNPASTGAGAGGRTTPGGGGPVTVPSTTVPRLSIPAR